MPKLRKVVEPKTVKQEVVVKEEEAAPKKDISKIVEKESVCSYCQQTIVRIAESRVEKKQFNGKSVDVYIFRCDRCLDSPNAVAIGVIYNPDTNDVLEVRYKELE